MNQGFVRLCDHLYKGCKCCESWWWGHTLERNGEIWLMLSRPRPSKSLSKTAGTAWPKTFHRNFVSSSSTRRFKTNYGLNLKDYEIISLVMTIHLVFPALGFFSRYFSKAARSFLFSLKTMSVSDEVWCFASPRNMTGWVQSLNWSKG